MTIDQRANEDFERALLKGFWRRVANWLLGGKNELLPFDEVRSRLRIRGQHYLGLKQVPIDQIIGSVGRYRDFDRAFLPTQARTRDRWQNIDKAHYTDVALPPVDLFKIGEVYFVKDGNHRVSVARERGQTYIDAYVIEIDVPVPLTADSDLDQVQLAQERLHFLEQSGIEKSLPEAKIESGRLGQYDQLLEHISAHRWYMGERRGSPVSYDEALVSWYQTIYLPIIAEIKAQELERAFPQYTPADLYLWITAYQQFLQAAYRRTQPIPDAVVLRQQLETALPGADRRLVDAMLRTDWVSDRLQQQEYGLFLEHTHLLEACPGLKIESTIPGAYDKLTEHIAAHRWYLGEQQGREVPYLEAVKSWCERVYQPLVQIIREQGVLEHFPGRTETDLYLWVIARQWALREAEGEEVPPQTAIEQLTDEHAPQAKKSRRRDQAGLPGTPDGDLAQGGAVSGKSG